MPKEKIISNQIKQPDQSIICSFKLLGSWKWYGHFIELQQQADFVHQINHMQFDSGNYQNKTLITYLKHAITEELE